ncbi:MAG TPA: universal stress protein [Dongiaceae bacterium]|nr:universal stress protein [Dongiaceae bacterium]
MSIKSIVALADGSDLRSVLSAAVSLTARLSARLEVLHIKADPYDAIPIGMDGMTAGLIDEIVDSAKQAIEKRRVQAKTEYDRVCGPSGQSASWKEVEGRAGRMLSISSRFADLLVVAQPDDKSSDALLEAADMAIFESGRPVVFIPPTVSTVKGSRVMIAWNGSTQAALAVTAALPLLRLAEQVDVVQAGEVEESVSANELALYLALHGIKVQNHAIDIGIQDIGAILISAGERFGSDLIVMGAYGHSRLRERILGGATRGLLEHSPWPIFMMH